MKLSSVVIVCLAESMMASAQYVINPPPSGCDCPRDRSFQCTTCTATTTDLICTTTCKTACVNFWNDPNHCGGCFIVVSLPQFVPLLIRESLVAKLWLANKRTLLERHQCPSGECISGGCKGLCEGRKCDSLEPCNDNNCYCFHSVTPGGGETAFCGPNVLCEELKSCGSFASCDKGEVCVWGTCCGRDVCVRPCEEGDKKVSAEELERIAAGLSTAKRKDSKRL